MISASSTLNDSLSDSVTLVDKLSKSQETASGKFAKFGQSMMYANQTVDAVNKIGEAYNGLTDAGIKFESSAAEMSAITDTSGKLLDDLSAKARDTAQAFGAEPAAAMDMYSKLLSKLSPELVKVPSALDEMTQDVFTLSKTMRGDTEAAVLALTTNMNQFNISLKNPSVAAAVMTAQMNVMAAGAQQGSAEVLQVAQALEQTGRVAKNAGVNFAETNAAIQILDKAGKKGAEGGVALRNVLTSMLAPNASVVKELKKAHVNMSVLQDKSLPLTDRLRTLNKVFGDDAIMTSLFGKENISAAQSLIQGADAVDDMKKKIVGTNVAHTQAAIIMDTTAEKLARQKTAVDNLKISFFDLTGGASVYVDMGMQVMTSLAVAGLAITGVTQLLGVFSWVWGLAATAARISCAGISTAIYSIPIIGWIAAGVAAIVGLGVAMYNLSADARGILFGVWESLKSFVIGGIKILGEWWKMITTVFNPANWFNGDADSAILKFEKTAYQIGATVASAYERGRKKGVDSYNADNKQPAKKGKGSPALVVSPDGGGGDTIIQPPKGGGGGGTGGGGKSTSTGIGGSGGGGQVRNITMNVTFTNHFHSGDMREISNRVMQQITAVLTDSVTLADS